MTDPLAHLEEAIGVEPDESARRSVEERAAAVIRPAGALARLDEVAVWLAGWQRTDRPAVERPATLIFAADHGAVANGVSAYPATVTKAMVAAVESGWATSSALAALHGSTLTVIDVGVGDPTADIRTADAMTPGRFDAAWNAGRDAVAGVPERTDLVVLGELGIGNTTAAAAVAAAIIGGDPGSWCGRGTGVDDDGLERKRQVVQAAVRRIGRRSPLDVLRAVGGAELVAMAGAAAECRRRSIPVLLDGFIATAALLPLHAARPQALEHCLAGHVSAEPGHRRMLDHLSLDPLIQLDLRLGEGSGALVALPIVRSATAAVVNVATFEEAGVAGPDAG